MLKLKIQFILSIFFIFQSGIYAMTFEEEKKYDELEGLDFLHALERDHKYQELLTNLQKNHFQSYAPEERADLLLLKAQAHYGLLAYEKSYKILTQSLTDFSLTKSDLQKNKIYNLLAKSSYQIKNYKDCITFYSKNSLDHLPSEDLSFYFTCLDRTNAKTKLLDEAIKMANAQTSSSPLKEDKILLFQTYFTKYGLSLVSQDLQNKLLTAPCPTVQFFLKMSQIFTVPQQMRQLLEWGHRCHPQEVEVTGPMVKKFYEDHFFHSMASLFENMTILGNYSYARHTAEFYKVAGHQEVADYYFIYAVREAYFESKASAALSQNKFFEYLASPIPKDLMAKKKDLSYAQAYAYFKNYDLPKAKAALKSTSEREGQLAAVIAQCELLDWRCRP